ncbi:MAG: tRNA lysidine(34) synthetase TilS [Chlamydiota bacterium]|nr:tRNA lysidine(34) synthetase TilS [Chlamydiota bacterium]
MKDDKDILTLVKMFVGLYVDYDKPLLIALSGGPDSLVLLDLLMKIPNLQLAVAHVDHNWRETSSAEAKQLESFVDKLGLRFHLLEIDPESLSGNLEDSCREVRYRYFRELCEIHGYQGVATGHHADDQSETVLKRFFEGSSISQLSGIRPVKNIFGVKVVRPLLSISKAAIERCVQKQAFQPFYDSTNLDPRFMRGRMRASIFPFLEKEFGKNIRRGMVNIAEEAFELEGYLDQKIKPYIESILEGPLGLYLDLSKCRDLHLIELKHLIRRLCKKVGFNLSRNQIGVVCQLVLEGAAGKRVIAQERDLHIDRGRLFFLRAKIDELPSQLVLKEGVQSYGNWEITVSKNVRVGGEEKVGWVDVWRGELEVYVPTGAYLIGPYKKNIRISKLWTDDKVPSFLRGIIPVLWERGAVVREFLSCRKSSNEDKNVIQILMKLKRT